MNSARRKAFLLEFSSFPWFVKLQYRLNTGSLSSFSQYCLLYEYLQWNLCSSCWIRRAAIVMLLPFLIYLWSNGVMQCRRGSRIFEIHLYYKIGYNWLLFRNASRVMYYRQGLVHCKWHDWTHICQLRCTHIYGWLKQKYHAYVLKFQGNHLAGLLWTYNNGKESWCCCM